MAREGLTDSQVEKEIERLNASEFVRLARKEQRLKYRKRQYLYGLRQLEKRGKELFDSGITEDILDKMDKDLGE